MNAVMKIIKDLQLEFTEQKFDMDCSLILKSWKRQTDRVVDSFSKITECKISLIEE
jgi:hypothetical protein